MSGFNVLVDRNEFAHALISLKKTTKLKNSFEIVLAYKTGTLTIKSLGALITMPASGEADADVRLNSLFLFKLAGLLPNINPLPLSSADDHLRIGSTIVPCSVESSRPITIELPINAELKDILALRLRYSVQEITRSGYDNTTT